MGNYEDDPGIRAAGRLAALALARACADAMAGGRPVADDAATAAGLFLAGRPADGDGFMPPIADEVVWLLGAQAQLCAAALWRLAAERAGRQPTPEQVTAVCDELEAGLLYAAG